MKLRFEINPPKVIQNTILSHKELQNSFSAIKQKIVDITPHCSGIHFTDSVLGIPRISPITIGALTRKNEQSLEITISLRVRDRNLTSLTQSICDSILLGINGVLVLKGDAPPEGPKDSGLIPSQVVKHFKQLGFDDKIDFFLSLPSNPNFNKIHKKIEAEPKGFITQVVQTVEEVGEIVDKLKPQGFKIIPVVMFPSTNNEKSAKFLNLDWSNYQNNFQDFVSKIQKLADDILITSPNDFNGAKALLENNS